MTMYKNDYFMLWNNMSKAYISLFFLISAAKILAFVLLVSNTNNTIKITSKSIDKATY